MLRRLVNIVAVVRCVEAGVCRFWCVCNFLIISAAYLYVGKRSRFRDVVFVYFLGNCKVVAVYFMRCDLMSDVL